MVFSLFEKNLSPVFLILLFKSPVLTAFCQYQFGAKSDHVISPIAVTTVHFDYSHFQEKMAPVRFRNY